MAPGDTALTHDGVIYKTGRAAMTDPADIARRMSADLDADQARHGFVSIDRLLLRGWTHAQITQHQAAALDLSSRAHSRKGSNMADRIMSPLGLILCMASAYFAFLLDPTAEAMAATPDAPVIVLTSHNLALAWGVIVGVIGGLPIGYFMAWCKHRPRRIRVPRDTPAWRDWNRIWRPLRHTH